MSYAPPYVIPRSAPVTALNLIIESKNWIVIGGMSFIGAKVSQYLDRIGQKVTVIEDAINIEPDPMRWYRWTELHKLGLSTMFVEFSDNNFAKLKKVVLDNSGAKIVYVPTGIFELNKIKDPAKRYQIATSHVVHFNKLLMTLKFKGKTKVILLSLTFDNNQIYKTWMTSIEQVLLSYNYQSSVHTTIVKVGHVFGPWQDADINPDSSWQYIDDIVRIVHIQSIARQNKSVTINSNHYRKFPLTAFDKGLESTMRWMKELSTYSEKHQTKNMVAGSYIIYASKDKWSAARRNNVNYFANWISSALAFNLSVTFIHNHGVLNKDIIKSMQKASSDIDIVQYSLVNKRIAHDQRFYMFYDYLLTHPEIKYFIVNDLRDCETIQDPVKIMTAIGDYFFAGQDIAFYPDIGTFPWLAKTFKICFPDFKNKEELFDTPHGVFNSGIIGGTRHIMLTALSRMVLLLEVAHFGKPCDMASQQIVFHKYYDKVVCSYPISGGYMLGIPGPHGMAMKHKMHERFKHVD